MSLLELHYGRCGDLIPSVFWEKLTAEEEREALIATVATKK